MTWLTEEPLYIFLTGILLVLGFGAFAMATGRRLLWMIAGVSLAVMVVLLVVESRIVTDREQLNQILDEMTVCVRNNDVQGLMKYGSLSRPETIRRIEKEMPQYQINSVSVFRRKIPEIDNTQVPATAKLEFQVSVNVDASQSQFRYSGAAMRGVTLFLQKEPDGQWRVTDYSHYEPELLGR